LQEMTGDYTRTERTKSEGCPSGKKAKRKNALIDEKSRNM